MKFIRRGLIYLSTALAILPLLSLSAQDKASTKQPELEGGTCFHAGKKVTAWMITMGYGTASYSCQSARVDWTSQIAFYRDANGEQLNIEFKGEEAEKPGHLRVTSIVRHLLGEVPATGTCRPVFNGNAPRNLQCFAKTEDQPDLAVLVEMTLADEVWPSGERVTKQGQCSEVGLARPGLGPILANAHGRAPDFTVSAQVECSHLLVDSGTNYTFIDSVAGKSTGFEIAGTEGNDGRHTLLSVTQANGQKVETAAGVCLETRLPDGALAVMCMAAITDGEGFRTIEAGFIPKGSDFSWPQPEGSE